MYSQMNASTSFINLHTDQVNRVQKATDASGAIVYDTLYTPFGVTLSTTGTLVQALRFPDQRADAKNSALPTRFVGPRA